MGGLKFGGYLKDSADITLLGRAFQALLVLIESISLFTRL